MKVVFSSQGWDDYLWWQRQDRKLLTRINQLIQDVIRHGNEGIGKPEPLKHGFQGYWSRRINDEHRLVYKVGDDEVRIAACRYHYESPEQPPRGGRSIGRPKREQLIAEGMVTPAARRKGPRPEPIKASGSVSDLVGQQRDESVNAHLAESLRRYADADDAGQLMERVLAVEAVSTHGSGRQGRAWTRDELHRD